MRIDFHVHSKFSWDSFMEPAKIIQYAKKRGLNGSAITDHDTIKGGIEAKGLIKSNDDFLVIVGAEIKTDVGEIIGLFLNEEIKPRAVLDVIDEIKCQDGIVVLPHPYRNVNKSINKLSPEIISTLDAIEAFNSRNTQDEDKKAQKFAQWKKMPMVGGSDAHVLPEVGFGFTLFEHFYDEEDIRKAILNIQTKVGGKHRSSILHIYSSFEREMKLKRPLNIVNLSVRYLLKNIQYRGR